MDFKKLLIGLAVLMVGMFAIAGTVSYLSNQATASVDVQSPIDNTLTGATIEGETVDATAPMTFYNGEELSLTSTFDNKSRVAQEGQLVVVITPALEVTAEANVVVGEDSTIITYASQTVPVDDPTTEEVDESVVTDESSFTVANNEPAEYSITTVFNVTE